MAMVSKRSESSNNGVFFDIVARRTCSRYVETYSQDGGWAIFEVGGGGKGCGGPLRWSHLLGKEKTPLVRGKVGQCNYDH
jgi:hypothetical protein